MEQVIQINKNVLSSLIRQNVLEALMDFLSDPDYGLELSDTTKKRLSLSVKQVNTGKTISLGAALKRYKVNP